MSRQIGLLIAIVCGTVVSIGQQPRRPLFPEQRTAASDLEVSGAIRDASASGSRFVSREWLQALPQTSLHMKRSDDFPRLPESGVSISGIYLDALAQSLAAKTGASAIETICLDGYTAAYSPEYLQQHRPLLVLKIDGTDLHAWATQNDQYDAAPYFVGYGDFIPAFHVLSHQDERLEPTGVVKLRFETEQTMYAGIRPAGAGEGSVMQGFRIAQQNCFRCHNAGDHGGTKAGKSWHDLAIIARQRPQWFAAWVHDPQSIKPKSKMPPNKGYDKATLTALQRYFETFAVEAAQ